MYYEQFFELNKIDYKIKAIDEVKNIVVSLKLKGIKTKFFLHFFSDCIFIRINSKSIVNEFHF